MKAGLFIFETCFLILIFLLMYLEITFDVSEHEIGSHLCDTADFSLLKLPVSFRIHFDGVDNIQHFDKYIIYSGLWRLLALWHNKIDGL